VIEDLISTGGSSLRAVEALRLAGAEVMGLGAIFSYGFEAAVKAFEVADCKYFTLSNYEILIDRAIAQDYAKPEERTQLIAWYQGMKAV
jgi:orotate phosphoribosyltransferase